MYKTDWSILISLSMNKNNILTKYKKKTKRSLIIAQNLIITQKEKDKTDQSTIGIVGM